MDYRNIQKLIYQGIQLWMPENTCIGNCLVLTSWRGGVVGGEWGLQSL